MAEVEKVLQSEEDLKLENFEIHVGTLKIPRGGRGRNDILNNRENIHFKRSIVAIENNGDNLCFDRSVVVCMAKLNSQTSAKKWKIIIDKRSPLQKQEALKLRLRVGLAEDIPITLQQIRIYEQALDVQIIVISLEKTILYHGSETRENKVFLYKDGDHFQMLQGQFSSVCGHYCVFYAYYRSWMGRITLKSNDYNYNYFQKLQLQLQLQNTFFPKSNDYNYNYFGK